MEYDCACGGEILPGRWDMGLRTCLKCGTSKETIIAQHRKQMMPAFHKGPYQLITGADREAKIRNVRIASDRKHSRE